MHHSRDILQRLAKRPGAHAMNPVLRMFSLLFSTTKGGTRRRPRHKTFIRNGSLLAETQNWHPPTCSTARSPGVNSAYRHYIRAAFRPVAQPRGYKQGMQDEGGNAAYTEARNLLRLGRSGGNILSTYCKSHGALAWEGLSSSL